MDKQSPNLQQLEQIAYQVADTLRKNYSDKGLPVPPAVNQQVLQDLQQQFPDLGVKTLQSALAQAFFENR